MAKEPKRIDIGNLPELLSIAQQVRDTQEPCLLRWNNEDVALITPIRHPVKKSTKGQPVTRDDALFRLIGIGRSGIPGSISGNKHKYLAQAYRHE